MTICDICETRNPTVKCEVKVSIPQKQLMREPEAGVYITTFDLCKECVEYLNFVSLTVGMKAIRADTRKAKS